MGMSTLSSAMKSIFAVLALVATSQAIPQSRATCEECVSGVSSFPSEIAAMSGEMEEDLTGHFCHQPDDPCLVPDFVNSWFPAVLENFVGSAAQDVCINLGYCNATIAIREITCDNCEKGIHDMSRWLESEEEVVKHVAFLQEGVCAGDAECSGNVADNYPDMNKHACQNFIVDKFIPSYCSQYCDATTSMAP